MSSPLSIYGEGLRCARRDDAASLPTHRVRLSDGSTLALDLARYLGTADAAERRLLNGLAGPVLDVGCGPGRHLHALLARGVFALGVDLSAVAVGLAVNRGARAIVADVFGELPGSGTWHSALLLDGNIGIGGCPERLLRRLAGLLADTGVVLVELDPPGAPTGTVLARLEHGELTSGWFPWARVAAPAIEPLARAAGFEAGSAWSESGRWFARLRRTPTGDGGRAAAPRAVAVPESPGSAPMI